MPEPDRLAELLSRWPLVIYYVRINLSTVPKDKIWRAEWDQMICRVDYNQSTTLVDRFGEQLLYVRHPNLREPGLVPLEWCEVVDGRELPPAGGEV